MVLEENIHSIREALGVANSNSDLNKVPPIKRYYMVIFSKFTSSTQVPLVQPIKRYKMVIFQKLTSFTSDPKDTSNANGDNDDSAWGNHLDALGDKG